jgi:glutathione-specific gamma-glutamylcyclotransferase
MNDHETEKGLIDLRSVLPQVWPATETFKTDSQNLSSRQQTDAQKHLLTRELIENGGFDAIVAGKAPAMRLLSDAERDASLRATLASRPAGDVWLFGYGSLIWNPILHFVERRTAHIRGWHRSFCLSSLVVRGSTDNPGLVLGLEAGGECMGVAFRIADAMLEAELSLLWRREMLSNSYVPRWLDVSREGMCFGAAIAFTVDQSADHYTGALELEEIIRRLSTATGALGSAADYLFRTCEALRSHGIPDPDLERLAARVDGERWAVLADAGGERS